MNKKTALLASSIAAAAALRAEPPAEISFTGDPAWSIASGVAIPSNRALFWTSGTVPDQIDKDGATVHARYGDTHAQAVSVLRNIEKVLATKGLTMKDVVYLRVYLTPDAQKDGKPDFAGWFKAYGEFFNNPANPVKPARSTLAVAALVNPDWLIEIEAFAAFPDAP